MQHEDSESYECPDKDMFLFHDLVGEGGFGKVLTAMFVPDRTWYAVKEINKYELLRHKTGITMLFSELSALSRLDHPFIVKLHLAFHDKRSCYLVLDLKTGSDLRHYLKKKVTFEEREVAFIVCCMSSAIHFLHSRRIIHRDVKPENIILDAKGYPHLADFGVAHVQPETEDALVCKLPSGTKQYLAPEVFVKSHVHGPEIDYWSLGVMAFEMLYQQRPFEKHAPTEMVQYLENALALMRAHKNTIKQQQKLQAAKMRPTVTTTSVSGVNASGTSAAVPSAGSSAAVTSLSCLSPHGVASFSVSPTNSTMYSSSTSSGSSTPYVDTKAGLHVQHSTPIPIPGAASQLQSPHASSSSHKGFGHNGGGLSPHSPNIITPVRQPYKPGQSRPSTSSGWKLPHIMSPSPSQPALPQPLTDRLSGLEGGKEGASNVPPSSLHLTSPRVVGECWKDTVKEEQKWEDEGSFTNLHPNPNPGQNQTPPPASVSLLLGAEEMTPNVVDASAHVTANNGNNNNSNNSNNSNIISNSNTVTQLDFGGDEMNHWLVDSELPRHLNPQAYIPSTGVGFYKSSPSPSLVNILTGFFEPRPSYRLGCNHFAKLRAHPWFSENGIGDWDAVSKKIVPPPFCPSKRFVHELQDPYTALLNESQRQDEDRSKSCKGREDEYYITVEQEEAFQGFQYICHSHAHHFNKRKKGFEVSSEKESPSRHKHQTVTHPTVSTKSKMQQQAMATNTGGERHANAPRKSSVSSSFSTSGAQMILRAPTMMGGKPSRPLPKIL